jgi:hypothetical protein
MQRTLASFALATLSLLSSYAIVAAWPDREAPPQPLIAKAAPVEAPTVIGLAD